MRAIVRWALLFGMGALVAYGYHFVLPPLMRRREESIFARYFDVSVRREGVGRRQHGYEENAHGYGPLHDVFRLALEGLISVAAARELVAAGRGCYLGTMRALRKWCTFTGAYYSCLEGVKLLPMLAKLPSSASAPYASQSSPACSTTGRKCRFAPLRRRDSAAPARYKPA